MNRRMVVGVVVVALAATLAVLTFLRGGAESSGAPGPGVNATRPVLPAAGARAVAPSQDGGAREVTTAAVPAEGVLDVLVTVEGAPAAAAEVTIARQVPESPVWQPAWEPATTARTDATGRATLPAREGLWLVSVAKAGLATAVLDVPRPAGERVTTVRVALTGGSVLRGRAVDDEGHGVAPALLRLTPIGERFTRRRNAPLGVIEAMVQPDGRFAVAGLAAGNWRIEGEAEGAGRAEPVAVAVPAGTGLTLRFRRSGFLDGVVVFADGGVAPGAAVSIVGEAQVQQAIEAGPTGTFSVERQPGTYRLAARSGELVGAAELLAQVRPGKTTSTRIVLAGKGGDLTGTVKRDDGVPVEGARLVLSPHNHDGLTAETRTGADGAFTLGGVHRGTFDLEAHAEGYESVIEQGFFIGEGSSQHVDLVVQRRGRVEGMVVDEAGAPLAVRVRLGSRNNAFAARHAVSDAMGRFVFESVPAGNAYVVGERDPDERSRGLDFKVSPSKTSEVKLVFARALQQEVLIDRTDCRSAGAMQVIAMEPGNFQRRIEREVAADVTSVRLALAPGTWQLMGRPADSSVACVTGMPRLDLVAGQPTKPITLSFGPEKDQLHVTVVERDGQPAANAMVTVRAAADTYGISSVNLDGEASFELEPGRTVLVAASKDGRSAQVSGVTFGTKKVKLVLQPAARLHLRLENASGMSRINLISEDESMVEQLRAVGPEAWIDEVIAGVVNVSVASADGTRAGRTTVKAVSGQLTEAVVRLEAPALVKGTIALPPDHAQAAWVTLKAANGALEDAQALADGSFEFPPLPAGTYTAYVVCPVCREWKQKVVTAAPGATVELSFP